MRRRAELSEHSTGTYTSASESKQNIVRDIVVVLFLSFAHVCKSWGGGGENKRRVGPRRRRWWVLTVSIYAKLLFSINPKNHKDFLDMEDSSIDILHRVFHLLFFLLLICLLCAFIPSAFYFYVRSLVQKGTERDDRKGQCTNMYAAASEYE